MMRFMMILMAAICAAALLLAGCPSSPAELQANGYKQDPVTMRWYQESKLAVINGCTISKMYFKDEGTLFISSCPGSVTWHCGKSACHSATHAPTPEDLKQQAINSALAKLTPEEMEVLGVKR